MTEACIQAFVRPNALRSSPLARKGWTSAATEHRNGWRVVTAESHRVTLVKGDHLVHFAPADADLDSPSPLSPDRKAAAYKAALDWARQNAHLVSEAAITRTR